MKTDAIEAVSIPMLITGIALLAVAGFFSAAREWIQVRVHGATEAAAPSTPGGRGESGLDGQGQSGGGGGGGGGQAW